MYFWLLLKNIPQRLKTGFVVEGHILRFCIWCDDLMSTTTSVVPLATCLESSQSKPQGVSLMYLMSLKNMKIYCAYVKHRPYFRHLTKKCGWLMIWWWMMVSLTVSHCQLWPSEWKFLRASCSQENERVLHTAVQMRTGPAGCEGPHSHTIYRCGCLRHEVPYLNMADIVPYLYMICIVWFIESYVFMATVILAFIH